MKFENTAVFNLEGALRSMRNPLNSWAKSDSHYCLPNECVTCKYCDYQDAKNEPYNWEACVKYVDWTPYRIGENDIDLAQRLIKGGPVHAKFMRAIGVNVDITAPTFWIHELDTYKVGTVRNSCSFMHKGTSKPFELSDFELCTENDSDIAKWNATLISLNDKRDEYLKSKDKKTFEQLRSMLPMGYNYKFTWTANYEVLRNIYHWRKTHRLSQWQEFCSWIETLPYAKELILFNNTPET